MQLLIFEKQVNEKDWKNILKTIINLKIIKNIEEVNYYNLGNGDLKGNFINNWWNVVSEWNCRAQMSIKSNIVLLTIPIFNKILKMIDKKNINVFFDVLWINTVQRRWILFTYEHIFARIWKLF